MKYLSLLHRREGIIISTIEALHEVGIQNLSTKEIARRQGVTEGALFRHFKNKTEILIGVLEHFSQYDEHIFKVFLNKELDPLYIITNFISTYAVYYENYPEITSVLHAHNSLLVDAELEEKANSIFNKRKEFVYNTLEQSKKLGQIKQSTDCKILTDIILGGFKELCLSWKIGNYKFSLKKHAVNMVGMIMKSHVVFE
ncbi:MAG: transcriptional regulator [Bacillales bacterium]|nr:transcriptional regulator [Bacillales bacterium]